MRSRSPHVYTIETVQCQLASVVQKNANQLGSSSIISIGDKWDLMGRFVETFFNAPFIERQTTAKVKNGILWKSGSSFNVNF